MLAQRVLTAVVLLTLLLGSLTWSRQAFAAVATVIMGVALAEWLQLAGLRRARAFALAAVFALGLLVVAVLGMAALAAWTAPAAVAATAIWLVLAVLLPGREQPRLPALRPVLGVALAILLMGAAWLAVMHFLQESAVVLLSVLALVWIADIAAYFVGRAFGRRKLAPHISPGKTWAGLYGAVAGVLGAGLFAWSIAPQLPFFSNRLFAVHGVAAALMLLSVVVAASVAGDLFESLLKRRAGVKDSSHLLPGHGGFYDRIDALVPVLPLAVVFEAWSR